MGRRGYALAGGATRIRLERFRAKWTPVRVKKTRQNKKLEPGSDSIRTVRALGLKPAVRVSGLDVKPSFGRVDDVIERRLGLAGERMGFIGGTRREAGLRLGPDRHLDLGQGTREALLGCVGGLADCRRLLRESCGHGRRDRGCVGHGDAPCLADHRLVWLTSD